MKKENEIKRYIGYIRVSTKEQGQSNLGLEAQKRDIDSFIIRTGGKLLYTYQEIESGTGKNAENRPILDKAIAKCAEEGATLVIAKIDRLYRDVYFISKLKHDGLEFLSLDNENANTTALYLLAAMAEDEADKISSRTKQALRSAKENIKKNGYHVSKSGNRITKLGNGHNFTEEGRSKGVAAIKAKFANNQNKRVAKLLVSKMMGIYPTKDITLALNENGMKAVKGGLWSDSTVYRLEQEIKREKKEKEEVELKEITLNEK